MAWNRESKLLNAHRVQQANTVLDLACGPGAITRRLAAHVPHAQVTGLDYEPRLLEVAQNATPLMVGKQPRFERGDVYALSPELGSFDFIYARFLFQHLERPADALAQIRSRLTPGGRILVVDVDDRDLRCEPPSQAYTDFVAKVATAQRRGGGNRTIGRELPALLEAGGFTNVRADRMQLDSRTFGLDRFFEITTAFKLEQLSEADRMHQRGVLEKLREEMKQTGTHIQLTVHCVSGESQ